MSEQKPFPQDTASGTGREVRGEYTVVARRYRPQTFDELIGQEHVARALKQAIATDRVGHAYLFTGARGVGKTSAARVLAKALNCQQGPSPVPCNTCDICCCIAGGNDVDVLEIDGASNRGIDEIRQLRQNVAIRPSRARFKIYIIDEVHMLTKEAFNALLKTLEEPPEHVKFIFATTEPNKIPITILSRCQRFDFAGIDARSIGARLTQVAAAEGVDIEAAAVQILAIRAAGSMRDSQSLLEQLLAVAEGTITAAHVESLLGIASGQRINELVRQMTSGNSAAALAELDAALAIGVDAGQFIDQLMGYFRDVLASAAGCPAEQLLYALPAQVDEIRRLAGELGMHSVLAILQILDQTAARMRVSMYARTLVEMAIVRVCSLERLDDLAEIIAELRDGSTPESIPVRRAPAPATQQPRVVPSESSSTPPAPDPAAARSVSPADASSSPTNSHGEQPQATIVGDLSATEARGLWEKITAEAGGLAASYVAVTDEVVATPEGALVVRFGSRGAFAHEQCQRAETQRQLQRAAESLCGPGIVVRYELPHGELTSPAATPVARPNQRQRVAEAAERPFVKKALSLFDVEPGGFQYAAGDDSQ